MFDSDAAAAEHAVFRHWVDAYKCPWYDGLFHLLGALIQHVESLSRSAKVPSGTPIPKLLRFLHGRLASILKKVDQLDDGVLAIIHLCRH